MAKVELFTIPEDIYVEVGRLTLFFSHIEWLTANALLFGRITPDDYSKVENMPVIQDHFEVLLGLVFFRKMKALSNLGFDTSKLLAVSEYRNTISHGIIFKEGDSFTVKKASKINEAGISLNKDELLMNIEILKEEGGKLLAFIESKGYKYHEPKSIS